MKSNSIPVYNIILLSILIITGTIYKVVKLNQKFPQNNTLQTQITPDTAFAFDLHGVIFTLDPILVIKELLNTPITKLFYAFMHPYALLNALHLMKKGEVAEEVVLSLEKEPELKNLICTGLRIINSQRLIPQTIDIIKELKLRGHKVYIFSNIGEQSIAMLAKRYPDIFAFFDGISSTSKNDNYIRKPDTRAFEKFLNEFNLEKSKVIFVDDKIENIKASISFGMPALIFTAPYNFKKQLNLT